MTQAEDHYLRRVQNHVTRGQYNEIVKAVSIVTSPIGRSLFSIGFLRGASKVLADNRTRSTSGLLKVLSDHPNIAQIVMPIGHDDPHLKGKLKLIFFAASHQAEALAQNCVKDLSPAIWDDLMKDTSLFQEFAYPLYQAVMDRNNMLQKFHEAVDTEQFLKFCKNIPPPSKDKMGGKDAITEIIRDRADFLDKDVVDLVTKELLPVWMDIAEPSAKWTKVYIAMYKAAQGRIPKGLMLYTSLNISQDAWQEFILGK